MLKLQQSHTAEVTDMSVIKTTDAGEAAYAAASGRRLLHAITGILPWQPSRWQQHIQSDWEKMLNTQTC